METSQIESLRLQAVLAEYNALREEILQKLSHHLKLYAMVAAGLGVILGWLITAGQYNLLLLVPFISTPLAFRYLWEQAVIVLLGQYIRRIEAEILPSLIGDRTSMNQNYHSLWVGWEHFWRENTPDERWHRSAVIILFVIIPFLPALYLSGSVIWTAICICSTDRTALPIGVYLLSGIIDVFMGIFLWKKILTV